MQKFWGVFAGIGIGGFLLYVGFVTFSGEALSGGGRRGRLFTAIVDALVGAVGPTVAGVILMVLGVAVGGLMIRSALSPDDDDEEEGAGA